MVPFIAVAVMLLAPALVSSQSSKIEWFPEEMYNPQMEPRRCGLNSDEASYICDPNGLTGEHIHSINWILRDAAYNSTRCPCSNYYCETYPRPLGYHIGVALVKKMKIQTNLGGRRNSLEDQGQLFANTLKDKWKMGRCEENIIIFYSYDDRVLAIYGGRTAMAKLTPYYRSLLSYRVGSRFSEGHIVEAINNLLYDLKTVLNCDSQFQDCGLLEMRSGVSTVGFSTSITVMAILLTVFHLFSI
ncbi:unnamed protein product [Candidula unifasciata]|uniref:Uncharacterized protein n=1 Tax=Candidula unifasciata TaxID=100452 RepID=A0A8S3ZQU4_9EUPU|nr:unnamed protein product [Candidula unifasciata]